MKTKIKATVRDVNLVQSMSNAQARLADAAEDMLKQYETRGVELIVEGPLHTIRITAEVV